jgi:hypothetical protein
MPKKINLTTQQNIQPKPKRKRRKSPEKQEKANQFDKIVKENSAFTIERIIEIVTGMTCRNTVDVPAELQRTIERRPDYLKQVIEADGTTAFWHVEYQVPDDKKMLARCFFYCGLCKNKAMNIPVRQFVIYLGAEKPLMETEIIERDLVYRFQLISLIDIPFQIFLQTGRPEEALLAMLGNLQGESPETVIRMIIEIVLQNTVSDLDQQKYFQQLQVMGQLRNFEALIENIMITESLRNYVSIERTPWYKLGVTETTAKFQKKLAQQETIWMKLVKEREQEIQAKELEKQQLETEQKQKQEALLQEQKQKQEALLQEQKQKQEALLQEQKQKQEALLQEQKQKQEALLQEQKQKQEALLQEQKQKIEAEQKQKQEALLQEQKQKQEALLQEQKQKQEALLQEQKQKEQIALQAKQQLQQIIALLLIDNHLPKEKMAFSLNISLDEINLIEAKILKIKALVATQILTVEEMAKTFDVTTIFIQLVANGLN